MLVTRAVKVPWGRLWLAQLPFAIWMFCIQVGTSTAVYSMKKFTDDAALIALALTLFRLPDGIFTPVLSVASDHTWTRWGRRTPYIVASGVFGTVALCFVPGMTGFWALVGAILCFQVMIYSSQVFSPLSQELVPNEQRGRASSMRAVVFCVSIALFYSVVVGRFDDVYVCGPLATHFGAITGEQFTYWLSALLMLVSPLFVWLGVTELRAKPPKAATAATVVPTGHAAPWTWVGRAVASFARDLFAKKMLGTYIVVLSWVFAQTDLQSFSLLLYTEQWGYSKQAMGGNIALGVVIMMPVIFLGGWLSDRFNKTYLMFWAQLAQLFCCLFYIFYVKVWLHGRPPTLFEILIIGEVAGVMKWVMMTMAWPLIFEYAPRERMGAANACNSIITAVGIASLVYLMGSWISGWSHFFGAPPGVDTTVVFAAPMDATRVQELAGAGIKVRPAPRVNSAGEDPRAWSLRISQAEVEQLLGQLKSDEGQLTIKRAVAGHPGHSDGEKAAAADEVKRLEERIATAHTRLDSMTSAWEQEVRSRLKGQLVAEGAVLRSGSELAGFTVRIEASRRCTAAQVGRLRERIRSTGPRNDGAIRLVDVWRESDNSLIFCGVDSSSADLTSAEFPARILGALAAWNSEVTGETSSTTPSLALSAGALAAQSCRAFQLELATLQPATAADLLVFSEALAERSALKLLAEPVAGEKAVRLICVNASATGVDGPDAYPGKETATLVEQAFAAAKESSIVFPRPVLDTSCRVTAYDYFSGSYLFAIQLMIACGLTLWLIRLEKAGRVHRQESGKEAT